jgi:hypothetical protein
MHRSWPAFALVAAAAACSKPTSTTVAPPSPSEASVVEIADASAPLSFPTPLASNVVAALDIGGSPLVCCHLYTRIFVFDDGRVERREAEATPDASSESIFERHVDSREVTALVAAFEHARWFTLPDRYVDPVHDPSDGIMVTVAFSENAVTHVVTDYLPHQDTPAEVRELEARIRALASDAPPAR